MSRPRPLFFPLLSSRRNTASLHPPVPPFVLPLGCRFIPFNPTDKRTVATVEGPPRPGMPQSLLHFIDREGAGRIRFRVAKGAPQVGGEEMGRWGGGRSPRARHK